MRRKFLTPKLSAAGLVLLIFAGGTSGIHAAPITYEGIISTPSGAVSGFVGGNGWLYGVASEVDFWSFNVGAGGLNVDIWATRTDHYLDPAMTLYRGTTSADESEFIDGFTPFGGMELIHVADDEYHPPFGLYGDPVIYNINLSPGTYTLAIGGYASDGPGPFPYQLFIDAPGSAPSASVVPLPAAVWLLGTGLLALLGLSRRRIPA